MNEQPSNFPSASLASAVIPERGRRSSSSLPGLRTLFAGWCGVATAAFEALRGGGPLHPSSGLSWLDERDVLQEPMAGIPGLERYRAVRLRPARAVQNAGILLLSESGEPQAVVKIAMAASGDELVTVEASWLKRLEAVQGLRGQMPRLLSEGTTLGGRRYLMTDVAPRSRTTYLLSPAHLRFLSALGAASVRHSTFTSSPCFQSLDSRLVQVERHLDPPSLGSLQAATRDCWLALSRWVGPFVISQGDFSPWNISVHGRSIFVSDWEQARTGANPMADILHYLLAPRAISRRGVTRRFFVKVLRRSQEAARRIHPGHWWDERVVSALALAYLLEALLTRAQANRALDTSNAMLASYLQLIEHRAEWLAA